MKKIRQIKRGTSDRTSSTTDYEGLYDSLGNMYK